MRTAHHRPNTALLRDWGGQYRRLYLVKQHQLHESYRFCWPDGHPHKADYVRRMVLYPALERAGVKIVPRQCGFHMFRHTLSTRVYEKTRDLKAVQELLGHAAINITANTYVHPSTEAVAQTILPLTEEMASLVWPEIEGHPRN